MMGASGAADVVSPPGCHWCTPLGPLPSLYPKPAPRSPPRDRRRARAQCGAVWAAWGPLRQRGSAPSLNLPSRRTGSVQPRRRPAPLGAPRRCAPTTGAATAPAQWGSLQDPRRGPFSSIRRRETCQAGEKPPLKALVRAFLVEFHTLLVCGYVFAFFTLFLDAPGPSLRAPSSDVEQHGVRWSMRKVTREASSSKRVGSQRCWNIKLVELLI